MKMKTRAVAVRREEINKQLKKVDWWVEGVQTGAKMEKDVKRWKRGMDEEREEEVEEKEEERVSESYFTCDNVILFSNFKDVCKKIFRRLYRVFVHVYIEHFERCWKSPASRTAQNFDAVVVMLCLSCYACHFLLVPLCIISPWYFFQTSGSWSRGTHEHILQVWKKWLQIPPEKLSFSKKNMSRIFSSPDTTTSSWKSTTWWRFKSICKW